MQFSVLKSDGRRPVGKLFSAPNGELIKQSNPFYQGTVRRAAAESLEDFANRIADLGANEIVSMGVCPETEAAVVTQRELLRLGNPPGTVTRTRNHFDWPAGPGLMLLDHDPPEGIPARSPSQLVETFREAIPEFASVTILQKASSSSFLFGADGAVLVGPKGQHLFVGVTDARQIPHLGQRIIDRLWLAGHGRFDLAANGRLLERTLFDLSVWQPERLIYHRASCRDGVSQQLPPYEIFPGQYDDLIEERWLDDRLLPPLTSVENERLQQLKLEARRARSAEAKRRREDWIEHRISQLSKGGSVTSSTDSLRKSFAEAMAEGVLPPELELLSEDGQRVSVAQLLQEPDRWHWKRFADPVEPDYRDDGRIAVAMLNGTHAPHIYSHAHGGTRYPLTVGSGEPSDVSDFDNLDAAVQVRGGGIQLLTASQFASGRGVKWLVKGLIAQGSLAMLYGPSGSGKSFFTLDLVWALAAGRQWNSLRSQKCKVIYVVAEGASGFRNRLNAFAEFRGPELQEIDLWVIQDGLDLRTGTHQELVAWAQSLGGVDLIVIDTLAQVIAGADENSAQDMGPILRRCNQIIDATGATILLVHHTGKVIERGARGWSGIRGALDTEVLVQRNDEANVAIVTKQKDGEEGRRFHFALTKVSLGQDDDGDEVTSCVVTHLVTGAPCAALPQGRIQGLLVGQLKSLEEFGLVTTQSLLRAVAMAAADDTLSPQPRPDTVKRTLKRLIEKGIIIESESGLTTNSAIKPQNEICGATLTTATTTNP